MTVDGVFAALADPTRRAVIRRLGGDRPASASSRATPDGPSVVHEAHSTLETGGLIRTRKRGRVRTCTSSASALALVDDWLAEQRAIWEGRTDRLERFVTEEDA